MFNIPLITFICYIQVISFLCNIHMLQVLRCMYLTYKSSCPCHTFPLSVLLPEFQGFCKQLLIQIFDNCWTFFPLSNFYYIQYSYQAVSFCLVMNICLQVTATRKTITNHECNDSGNTFFSCLVLFYRYISQLQVFRVRLINPYLTD